MDLNELIVRKQAKQAEILRFIEVGEAEKRELTENETATFSALETEIRDLENQITAKSVKTSPIINKEKKMNKKFSLLRAIEARANGKTLDEAQLEVIEAGRNEMRKSGLSYSGDIVLPTEYRATIQSQGAAGTGIENVNEEKLGILAPLREALVLVKAGATFLTGMTGDISIPKYSATNATWKGESAAADDGAGTFSEIVLQPKRLTTYFDVSKMFLNQDSTGAEAMLMNDIVVAIANKLEGTILGKAAGSSTQPAGLFNTAPSINGSVTWANMVALETAVDTSNALIGNLKYITNAAGRGLLKATPRVSGQPIYLINDAGELNGYPVLSTNLVANALQVGANENGIVFGNFGDLVIAQWGALDITVDAISQAINGNVRIVVSGYFDAKLRRTESVKTGSIKA